MQVNIQFYLSEPQSCGLTTGLGGGRSRLFCPSAGFQLSSHLLQMIVLRYADEKLQLDFDDYLNCLVRLENASRECVGELRVSLDPLGIGDSIYLRCLQS